MRLPVARDGGRGQPLQLAAVDKRLEDVLLDIQVAVVDRGELGAQGGQVLDGLVHDRSRSTLLLGRLGPEDAGGRARTA